MTDSKCLQRGWKNSLATLFKSAREELLVCSPYITDYGIRFVQENISPQFQKSGLCTVVTNLTPMNILQGSTEPRALQQLSDRILNFALWHLPKLHAKIYIADSRSAIVTSANLTRGGVEANYEYGVEFNNRETVQQIRDDLVEYSELGVRLSQEQLCSYVEVADEVRTAFQQQQRTITRSARAKFEQLVHKAENELITLRISGVSRTQVFERTIEYLLGRDGAMTTPEIHSRIAAIHPDLCDETIDRIINGQHFGKQWKHAVRAAQSHLKERGIIELVAGRWKLKR